MKKLWFMITVLGILFLLIACVPNRADYESVVAENEKLGNQVKELKAQISALKSTLEGYELDPVRLYVQLENAYMSDDYESVKNIYEKLTTYHIDYEYYPIAKNMYNEIITMENALRAQEQKELRDRQEAARLERERIEKEKLASLDLLIKDHDDISGITWYKQNEFVHYYNTNLTSIYIGEKGDSVWLRLKMSFTGNDWIFFERAYLSYEGNTLEIKFNEYENKKTEILSGGSVAEWIDVTVNKKDTPFLKALANSSVAKMRLEGKHTRDRLLSEKERKGILEVLKGYEVLITRK